MCQGGWCRGNTRAHIETIRWSALLSLLHLTRCSIKGAISAWLPFQGNIASHFPLPTLKTRLGCSPAASTRAGGLFTSPRI
ncbi:hypothetical protein BJY04DRAFT_175844 [Aspergillus karnatakaensis]|uniref:uncharacterized protein n=1 Tax=Aspergillus karnatakaensis TaxID=1810916 RepID=UPI003CCDA6E8